MAGGLFVLYGPFRLAATLSPSRLVSTSRLLLTAALPSLSSPRRRGSSYVTASRSHRTVTLEGVQRPIGSNDVPVAGSILSPCYSLLIAHFDWILQSLRAFRMTQPHTVSIAFRAVPPASLIAHCSLLTLTGSFNPFGLSG